MTRTPPAHGTLTGADSDFNSGGPKHASAGVDTLSTANAAVCASAIPSPQPRNPLHGVTLQAMVEALADHFGWDGLGEQIPIRCFQHEPSVASTLKFLRKTPWAREKVESLYLFMLREQKRNARG